MIARMMEQTIDKREDGDALRHTELASHLRNEIADGLYDVGERFPTELELKIRFGVGRHTVREALKVLVEEGLIHRRRKLGSVGLRGNLCNNTRQGFFGCDGKQMIST